MFIILIMRRERYFEEDFNGFVEGLINSSRLEGKEAGIAKQMLDKGYDSLSEKQKFVFDRAIENNTVDECKFCGADIPWGEMLAALDNEGYCGHCQHMMEKMNEE